TVDTPGLAIDLAVDGGYAYVADGSSGLQVIDLANPLAPVRVASLDTPGTANGIDVAGSLAVLTDLDHDTQVIDVSVASAPLRLALVPPDPFDTRHRTFDVELSGAYAYLATERGLRTLDLGAPASPIDLGTTGSLFQTDVTLSPRKVLFGASTVRFDAVLGLYDGSRGGAPQALGELALDPAFGGDTTGVAADDRFLYVTGTRGAATLGKPGYLGQTRMFIARYADFTDGAGIAPTVSFESPADGGSATAGRPLQVVVRALDDVGVAEVRLLRTGHPAEVDPIPPYAFTITPTEAGTEIALDAVAVDFAGHQAAAP